MTLHYDNEVRIFKIKCGNHDNNAYIVVDPETSEGVIIDAPDEPEKILEEVRDVYVKAILITHVHADQLRGLHRLRSQTEAPVWVSVNDAIVFNYFTPVNSERPENPFHDGALLPIGRLALKAINTPGHTPGSTCYLVGKHLFTGDTLFSGGPGHTANPERLQQCIQSITQKLFVLPDDTIVYPGRGDDTTLTTAKAEYQTFSSRSHPPNLHGDVPWLTS